MTTTTPSASAVAPAAATRSSSRFSPPSRSRLAAARRGRRPGRRALRRRARRSAVSPSAASGDQTPAPRTARRSGSPSAIRELTARLHDNATARDLAAQLPLTLTFRDHNNVEKTAPLPRELSLDGAPEGHDPAAGDIGYWAPDGDLVLYYDSDAPFFNGIVRIGEFDGDMDALERQSDDFSVTIERAG